MLEVIPSFVIAVGAAVNDPAPFTVATFLIGIVNITRCWVHGAEGGLGSEAPRCRWEETKVAWSDKQPGLKA